MEMLGFKLLIVLLLLGAIHGSFAFVKHFKRDFESWWEWPTSIAVGAVIGAALTFVVLATLVGISGAIGFIFGVLPP